MGRRKVNTSRKARQPLPGRAGASTSSHRQTPTSKVLRSRSREQRTNATPALEAQAGRPLHPRRSREKSTTGRPPVRKPPEDDQFLDSPSTIWRKLPFKHRLISLVLGFLSLYYAVFAKHHHYDREIVAIHADVEELIRQANATILKENLVEAELPKIFQDNSPAPFPKSSPSVNTRRTALSGSGDKSDPSEAKDSNELPLKKKKKRRKKKLKKNAADTVTKATGNETSVRANAEGKAAQNSNLVPVSADQDTNSTGSGAGLAAETVQGTQTAADSALPFGAGRTAQTNQSVLLPNATDAVRQKASGVSISKADSSDGVSSPPQNAILPLVGTSGASGPNPAQGSSGNLAANAQVPAKAAARPEEEYDYSKEFKDLETDEVPTDHVPVLSWNYPAVLDPKTTEHIFGLGNKLDHVAVYKPLCLEAATGQAFSFIGNQVCSGFNRTSSWMVQYCNVMKESLTREYLLKLQEDKPVEWLTEKASAIHWVEGLTVVQILEKNCGNIAHFSGRALILQHIIDNIAAYVAPPSRIENIIVLPTFHIMKRFLYPHNYEFWHKSVFLALIAPAKFTIGTLGNFLYREQKIPYSGTPRVQLLHNFSVAGSIAADKQYVCFKRAVVPGYLKARFFVNDIDYPSKQPSLQSGLEGAPPVPRDSLRFRERMSLAFTGSPNFPVMKKEIVLLDRKGSRRVFDNATRLRVLEIFEKVSAEHGYAFKAVSFDHMNFTQQYETMKTVAVAIGIHGANLVNSMFMPPMAVLVELFPHGFMHDMYSNGGNAGLKYFKYQMVSGVPFPGPKQYRTVQQCIEYNKECKVHYRDSPLKVTDTDLQAMETILRQAVAWCDERQKPFTSGEAQKAGAQNRRRRRLLYHGMDHRQLLFDSTVGSGRRT